ncbi:immunity 26/phosphotriesterase HocA family protein [Citrobacter werkmanii]|uniref:immunity 26/phosphotriesterase HocA family protein n=1 Tax=Citrobacter werkmanii TaxID=67827 RepID=UPI002F2DB2F7
MSNFKFWGWNKKPRTMLRFIKPGDIFCFQQNEERYFFGRIISKIMTGHVVEIFNYSSNQPSIDEQTINSSERLFSPIVIDTYGLFDRKIYNESDYRIIGHQNNYTPTHLEHIYFTYGIDKWCKKVDIWGNETPITSEEAKTIPDLSPYGDYDIKQLLKEYLKY